MTIRAWNVAPLLLWLAACSPEEVTPAQDSALDARPADTSALDQAAPDQGPPPGWRKVTPKGAPPIRRTVHLMVYDPDARKVLLVGGQPGNSSVPLGDIWTWDGVRWSEL